MVLKSFHFSIGNSYTGPVGMCIRVKAESPEEAVRLANEQLSEYPDYEFPDHTLTDGVEYCNVYFNPSGVLTVADIDEENEIEMFSREGREQRRIKYSTPRINARFFSDDLHVDFNFDANRWFQDASDEEIDALSAADWGTSLVADRVALFMESRDLAVEKGLTYVRLANLGFEVEVREEEAKQWIALHRPNILIPLK